MSEPYTLTQFTPAEAEAITGVSNNVQRDWRRHGYLRQSDGHARFNIFDLGKMLTMAKLSQRGIGPKDSFKVAEWCAEGIAVQCFAAIEAYEGNFEYALTWFPEKVLDKFREEARQTGSYPMPENWLKALVDTGHDSSLIGDGSLWSTQASWLSLQIMRRFKSGVSPAPFFVWWADDTHDFLNSVDDVIESSSSNDKRFAGAIVVLDLLSLSEVILEKCGRALVHVEFEVDAKTNRARAPMEYS